AVAVGVWYVNRAIRQIEPAVAPRPTAEKDSSQIAKQSETIGKSLTKAPAAIALSPQDRSLEAVGGLSAAHLDQTYLNIGLLADATEKDAYSDEDARKILTTITVWVDNIDQQLGRLSDAGIDPEDQKKIAQVRSLTGLLRTQAKELRAYWDTP